MLIIKSKKMYLCKLFPFCSFNDWHHWCRLYPLDNNNNIMIDISIMIERLYNDYESFIQSCYVYFEDNDPIHFTNMC